MAAREMEGETDVGSSERRRRGMLVLEARGYIIRKGERKGLSTFASLLSSNPSWVMEGVQERRGEGGISTGQ